MRFPDLDGLAQAALIALVVVLPFEIRTTPPIPTELQITFLIAMLVALPRLVRERHRLLRNRAVRAALAFAVVAWVCAAASPEFTSNAVKGAVRYSAGVAALVLAVTCRSRDQVFKAWSIAATAAAIYALADYLGFGYGKLFRDMEFYFEDVRRVSGSFEYPNTAAAYYALSLPIVWTTVKRRYLQILSVVLLWTALILTFSRGAILAVLVVAALWAAIRRSAKPLAVIGIGVALYAGVAFVQPLLIERAVRLHARKPVNAEYKLTFNKMRERPGIVAQVPIEVRNVGRDPWTSAGEGHFFISYYWYDTVNKVILDVPSVETALPETLASGDSVTVNASFRTPNKPGLYLLDWGLQYSNREWFSFDGVIPAVVESEIASGADTWRGNGDISRWYRKADQKGPEATAELPRPQLWRAALMLFAQHPLLGIGPDNYRLVYGQSLGFAKWDTNVHSNSLYLEILVSCGALGLFAFLVFVWRLNWQGTTAVLAVAVSLVHGFFDFFLMTTPIYLAFWLLAGCAIREPHEDRV